MSLVDIFLLRALPSFSPLCCLAPSFWAVFNLCLISTSLQFWRQSIFNGSAKTEGPSEVPWGDQRFVECILVPDGGLSSGLVVRFLLCSAPGTGMEAVAWPYPQLTHAPLTAADLVLSN